ncbi:MAG: hypothetical protein Ct9H300mP27_12820 [Chloroflexota bacterium]|nr:MAG: hypothetical protein Ct9H300mP27_12820 [Chloroflexota bacterium]
MASHSLGMSLFEAARQMGVPFVEENEPIDKFVQVHGLNFHYLEWGDLLILLSSCCMGIPSKRIVGILLACHYLRIIT